jgi:hypothetical protein
MHATDGCVLLGSFIAINVNAPAERPSAGEEEDEEDTHRFRINAGSNPDARSFARHQSTNDTHQTVTVLFVSRGTAFIRASACTLA